MLRSNHYLLDKIWNHLSVVNRDAETDTCFDSKDVEIKTEPLSKDAEIKTWFCQSKFGIICQVLVWKLTSKHKLSDKIWNQLQAVN